MREMAPRLDQALSRRLLGEAGIQPGQLKLTMYSLQGPLWGAVATFLQSNLAAVGIEATVARPICNSCTISAACWRAISGGR